MNSPENEPLPSIFEDQVPVTSQYSKVLTRSIQGPQLLKNHGFNPIYPKNNAFKQTDDLIQNSKIYLSKVGEPNNFFSPYFDEVEVTSGFFYPLVDLILAHEQGAFSLSFLDEMENLSDKNNQILQVKTKHSGVHSIKLSAVTHLENSFRLIEFDLTSSWAFRTIDGSDNNLNQSHWGAANTQLLRLTAPDYADGISEPRGGFESNLPNPREISRQIVTQNVSIPNFLNLSDWFWQWGQFIDHDMDLTESANPLEVFNIEVPTGDPFFDPSATGTQIIPFNRSIYAPYTGIDSANPRQQINEITAYLDGSMIYGSHEAITDALRTHDGTGQLLTSFAENGEVLLPFNVDYQSFLAGDSRVDEQIGLTTIHTLFLREHNRLATQIGQFLDHNNQAVVKFFDASNLNRDEFIYQTTRRLIGAKIQIITYDQFLPLLIGEHTLSDYQGYDPTVNPGISNEFSTAAFRFGHTMLSPQLLQIDGEGTVEEISLKNAFFQPHVLLEDGIDSLLRGLASQTAQDIDTFLIDDVCNFLFGAPGSGGFDLASLNIQRGRDHGLGDLNSVRHQLGLPVYDSFLALTSGDDLLANRLASVYDSIDHVDLWIGGLAEKPAPGAMVGQTFQTIIADQFTRLRDGDRFWYENDPYLLPFQTLLEDVSLSSIIKANSTVTDIQDNAFIVPFATDVFNLGQV